VAERPAVTFVTCAALPDAAGELGPVTAAMQRHGIACRWEVWDDRTVAWSATPLVAIRTTWDYSPRHDEFMAWARRVESVAQLINPVAVLEWNTHKGYLVDLTRAGVPCVPTFVGRPGDPVDPAVLGSDRVVVKPAVGAGGIGLELRSSDAVWDGLTADAEQIVQPFLGSVLRDGERSVFVIGGRVAGAVAKQAAEGEIRVHEEYGGQFRAIEVDGEVAELAVEAVAASSRRLDLELPYARVDFLRSDDGRWLVSELELVEPGLYPRSVPEVVESYAAVVAAVVRRVRRVDVG
jgi:glutathione synthase/RimK-type ligase-like ATP-grasp enzyme